MRSLREALLDKPVAGAAIAALVAFAIYLPSLKNGFTYDDRVVVVENRFITDLGNIPHLVSKDYFQRAEEKSWRPVTTLSYFVDHALWGKKPFGYHLTNVLLHAVTVALVVLVLAFWGATPPVALLGGLLFALHPVASAAVEAVSFRDDVLAALFVVAGLAAYRAATKEDGEFKSGLYIAPFCYAAACLSKENAIVLPALAWALDVVVDKRPLFVRERRRVLALGSLAAVGVGYLALRFGPMAGPEETYRYLGQSPVTAAITAPAVLFRSVKLLFAPVGLSPVRWVEPLGSPANPLALAGLAVLAAGVGLALWTRRRAPRAAAALAWMAIAWMPVSGIVPLTHPMADRYLYLPLVGFVWVLAEGVGFLLASDSKALKGAALATAGILLVGWAGFTLVRHSDWKSELTLWSSAVANEPASYRAHFNLGDALDKAGRLGEAEASYRKALELKPVFSMGHYSLGRLLYRTGRKAEAAVQFKEALADKPDYAAARNHLGLIYAERGELGRARIEYEAALRAEPSNANVLNNLGILASREGKPVESEDYFRRATEASPLDPKGFSNLGVLLAQAGRSREAQAAFQRALALDPEFGPAQRGLASLRRRGGTVESSAQKAVRLAKAGRMDEAVSLLQKEIADRPQDVALRHTLATTLLRAGRRTEARKELEAILEVSPSDILALRRMASLERRAGSPTEALRYLDAALASNPSDVSLLTEKGLTLGQAARLREAEESIRKAISIRPEFAPAHEGLGRVLLASGRYKDASSAFRRALELDPSLSIARRGLAEAERRSSGR